ncbi:MAG: autotransporter-associated beta strand repeat protein [Deltaproteobacteria bacterium]|nr:autotransporter-associated beta strand repeat protein [Deltaproteobacteria bacterium]
MCKNVGTTDASFCLSYRPTGRPTYYTAGNNLDGATAVAVGEWHHLATTWDGTTKRGYFDGTLDRSLLIAAISADAGSFVVGAALATPTLRFDGTIDEVVYYDRVLSPAEVQQLASP